MRCTSMFGPQTLGRIRRCGPIEGGVSLETGLRFQKPPTISNAQLLTPACRPECELSAAAPAACHMPLFHHHKLTFGNHEYN